MKLLRVSIPDPALGGIEGATLLKAASRDVHPDPRVSGDADWREMPRFTP